MYFSLRDKVNEQQTSCNGEVNEEGSRKWPGSGGV